MIEGLSDKKLLKQVEHLVSKEREIIHDILELLQEVQERRLFADLGYSSLFKYLVGELKYSEGAACLRLGALRLSEKVPEARKMIERGELSLSVATKTFRYCEKMNPKELKQVLKLVANKNKDEATKALMSITQCDPAAGL